MTQRGRIGDIKGGRAAEHRVPLRAGAEVGAGTAGRAARPQPPERREPFPYESREPCTVPLGQSEEAPRPHDAVPRTCSATPAPDAAGPSREAPPTAAAPRQSAPRASSTRSAPRRRLAGRSREIDGSLARAARRAPPPAPRRRPAPRPSRRPRPPPPRPDPSLVAAPWAVGRDGEGRKREEGEGKRRKQGGARPCALSDVCPPSRRRRRVKEAPPPERGPRAAAAAAASPSAAPASPHHPAARPALRAVPGPAARGEDRRRPLPPGPAAPRASSAPLPRGAPPTPAPKMSNLSKGTGSRKDTKMRIRAFPVSTGPAGPVGRPRRGRPPQASRPRRPVSRGGEGDAGPGRPRARWGRAAVGGPGGAGYRERRCGSAAGGRCGTEPRGRPPPALRHRGAGNPRGAGGGRQPAALCFQGRGLGKEWKVTRLRPRHRLAPEGGWYSFVSSGEFPRREFI